MIIFRRSKWFLLVHFALMTFLFELSFVTREAFAIYGGSHISVEPFGPIQIGYSADFHTTVKNTGTDRWYYYPFNSQTPGWIFVIRNLSWLPNASYEFYVRFSVGPGEISGGSALLTPERLPSSEGNYSFQVYAYYPKDYYGSTYLLMDNSPKTVNFTMLPKAPTLSVSTSSLNQRCPNGKNALSQSFEIWNSGQRSFTYIITDDVEWLSVSPGSGSNMGEHDVIQVNYDTSRLSPGTYYGMITVKATEIGVLGSLQTIKVTLSVIPAGMPWIQLLLD